MAQVSEALSLCTLCTQAVQSLAEVVPPCLGIHPVGTAQGSEVALEVL